jgi:hypothetical protein
MTYRCTNCGSAHVYVYQEATAIYEQDDDGLMVLVDTETFDEIEEVGCCTCSLSIERPGYSTLLDWEVPDA